jgi:hypothetical protein
MSRCRLGPRREKTVMPMVRIAILMFVLAMLGAAATAQADGTVARAKGCGDKIFASSLSGYSVLAGTGEGDVADGDLLVGELEKIGHVTLYDRTSGRSIFAVVEEYGIGKGQITQRIAASCRSFLANTFTSGRVTRATGCGNKLFVDTASGYAVLERLAGGIVSEGDILSGNFNRAGRATVTDKQTGGTLTVFVDDFQLPRSAVQRKITANCR